MELGAPSCTDAEILAILIGSGGAGYSAEDVARAILDKFGALAGLMDRPLKELTEVRGIGPAKAIRIAAAYELTSRIIKHLENNG